MAGTESGVNTLAKVTKRIVDAGTAVAGVGFQVASPIISSTFSTALEQSGLGEESQKSIDSGAQSLASLLTDNKDSQKYLKDTFSSIFNAGLLAAQIKGASTLSK